MLGYKYLDLLVKRYTDGDEHIFEKLYGLKPGYITKSRFMKTACFSRKITETLEKNLAIEILEANGEYIGFSKAHNKHLSGNQDLVRSVNEIT